MNVEFQSKDAVSEYLEAPSNLGVEQWLSSCENNGFRFIRWIRIVKEVFPDHSEWCLYECNSLDEGNESYIDIDEFEDVGDPDEPEGKRHTCASAEQALSVAASLGAADNRYVMVGGLQYIYRDFFLANGPPLRGAKDWFISG